MHRAVVLFLAAWALAGCKRSPSDPGQTSAPPPTPSAPPSVASSRVTLRILYTSDEHGWIAPAQEKGRIRGGAAALLARWRQDENHCVPTASDRCESASDVALSGGDNWTGPAISTYFRGEGAAEALRLLGYAASALGNHELDFGRARFDENAAHETFPYVAANVSPPRSEGGPASPFVLVKRAGVTIGIVGLALRSTPQHGLRDNYKGLEFGEEERALVSATKQARDAGANVVVAIDHVCAVDLEKIVQRHPELRLAFVGAGHCHRLDIRRAGETPIAEPGSYLRSYVRASVVVDKSLPQGEQWLRTDVEAVDLTHPAGTPDGITPDPAMAKMVDEWQKKTDAVLGEVIGYSGEPLEPDTPQLTNFLTDRWREAVSADAAILNRSGTRQAIPKGPITLETIYSVLPFDNHIVTVKITGEQLLHDVACCHGHVSGLRSNHGKIEFSSGAAVDPKAIYKVAVTDYTYYGGSDFPFEKQDANGVFGEDWRDPVVKWLKAHPTSAGHGVETLIDKAPRPNDR